MLLDNKPYSILVCLQCFRRGDEKALVDFNSKIRNLHNEAKYNLVFNVDCEICKAWSASVISPNRIVPIDDNNYVIVYDHQHDSGTDFYECRTKDTDYFFIDPICPACNKKHERKRVGLSYIFIVKETCKVFKEKWPKGHAIPRENYK